MSALFFSTFEVTRQAFYRTSLSFAIVNLKPITPGHVLVVSARPVPRITDLKPDELTSLMSSVQRVSRVVERAYGASAITIACQDGPAAGQSVPHVHFHILPRRADASDPFFKRNDDVYDAIDNSEASLKPSTKMDAEEDRKPRTEEEMEKEALWLKTFCDAEAEN